MAREEVYFSEVGPEDAVAFLAFFKKISQETDYLVLSDGLSSSVADMEEELYQRQLSSHHLILQAKVADEIVGVVSVRTASEFRISHIGTIFIAVCQDYWGYGIGTCLLTEVLDWAQENPDIHRLELTVQVRNERAVHLYEKLGFVIEGIQKRGARTDKGEWLDLYYMGQLLDKV